MKSIRVAALAAVSTWYLACKSPQDTPAVERGIAGVVNVCYAYRKSPLDDDAAEESLVALLHTQASMVAYQAALKGYDKEVVLERERRAAKLEPGSKLRKLWRGDGWIKVLVVGAKAGNVQGWVLASECHPLPPRGMIPAPPAEPSEESDAGTDFPDGGARDGGARDGG